MPDPTDRDLLRLAARGDAAAFGDFYRRYVRVERIERLADEAIDGTPGLDALERLPAAQREAVRARILDERSYGEIASRLRCSGAVVRQRVSRGLRALASELEDGR